MSNSPASPASFITPAALLDHWQGHRRLTRRVIEAFPADQLFRFSLGGMRPFGVLAREMVQMAGPMVRGVVTGNWDQPKRAEGHNRKEILHLWDAATAELDTLWPRIAPERFQETITAFGQYEGKVHDLLLYVIDNEIHHRGQGYVYLRALEIEPPPFYERQ
ncbi:MAG TPA: DinB family protein [Longimicrobiaceae bacterium]|nr:DinB family protein [Longimicrobiaceae bacterium]